MKVLSEKAITAYLTSKLSQQSILKHFQPALLKSLVVFESKPNEIVPPRIAQASNNNDSGAIHLFMPCLAPEEVGIKMITGSSGGFQGCVVVLDEFTGETQAILNAATLTAFRTALASTLGLTKVIDVSNEDVLPEMCVFGVGAQSYWHTKLALTLYKQIKEVNVINRSKPNAEKLAKQLQAEYPDIKFNGFSYQTDVSEITVHGQNSSIFFGCLPSTEAAIKKEFFNTNAKYPKFVSLIGSYKPHMIELDLDLIISEFKNANVAILVDSKDHTLHEAGELIQSGIDKDGLIEISELYTKNIDPSTYTTSTNLTVQKIVGLAAMDLSIGKLIAQDTANGATEVEF